MIPREYLVAYLASNLFALGLLAMCWTWRNAGRFVLSALFLWASQLNLRHALIRPEEYLGFARFTPVPAYREFILGVFAAHTGAIVAAIAIGQLVVGVLLILRGRAAEVGLMGAIVFFLAIAPLGLGSAFPCTLILAGAATVLLLQPHDRTLADALLEWWRRPAAR